MSDLAVRVDGLGKRYRLGNSREPYGSLRDQLSKWASPRGLIRLAARRNDRRPQFWALRHVSFDVRRGEVVGIIGRNGAGKSTLLKVLSRITEPTAGEVDIHGRVGSLLEVGTGFHPELTGRENIYLNGAILGMRRADTARKFDDIVAFADVSQFVDTPVKHYSSGMYTRLAFAVAAHLEPEILVVDEVLAVGDAEFQKRCLGKMSEVARDGRTVLFVSHNMVAVQRLCTRGILLRGGEVVKSGNLNEVISEYMIDYNKINSIERPPQPNGRPSIVAVALQPSLPGSTTIIFDVQIESSGKELISVDLRLTDAIGNPVGFGSLGGLATSDRIRLEGGTMRVQLGLGLDRLANGEYVASFDLANPGVEYYDRADGCLRFEVDQAGASGRDRVLLQSWQYGSWELDVRQYST